MWESLCLSYDKSAELLPRILVSIVIVCAGLHGYDENWKSRVSNSDGHEVEVHDSRSGSRVRPFQVDGWVRSLRSNTAGEAATGSESFELVIKLTVCAYVVIEDLTSDRTRQSQRTWKTDRWSPRIPWREVAHDGESLVNLSIRHLPFMSRSTPSTPRSVANDHHHIHEASHRYLASIVTSYSLGTLQSHHLVPAFQV